MAKQPPTVHPKNPQTGKGQLERPPQPKLSGSQHVPKTGK